MDLNLEGKRALVTAASKGLGAACALALAREGARVSICSRSATAINEAAAKIRTVTGAEVIAFAADVTKPEDVNRLVEGTTSSFGGVDILVTNSGGPPPGAFVDLSEADFIKALELNFLSTFRLIKAVAPGMQEQNWGRIINITSVGVKQPLDGLILSNTARAAVVGFAKSLANELGPYQITVNNLCPGLIATERIQDLMRSAAERQGKTLEQIQQERRQATALKRFGRPEEFASVVAFLASDLAGFITGVTLQVDGGMVKGIH